MKGYLPVHCCCEPGRRFGWVPAPSWLRDARRAAVRFHIPPEREFIGALDELQSAEIKSGQVIYTEVNELALAPIRSDDPCEIILAVNSADQPIEVWRQVPGFIEEKTNGTSI